MKSRHSVLISFNISMGRAFLASSVKCIIVLLYISARCFVTPVYCAGKAGIIRNKDYWQAHILVSEGVSMAAALITTILFTR